MKTIFTLILLTLAIPAFAQTKDAVIALEIVNLATKKFNVYPASTNPSGNPGNRAYQFVPGQSTTLYLTTNEFGWWPIVRLADNGTPERTNAIWMTNTSIGKIRQVVLNNLGDVNSDTWTDNGYSVASIPLQQDVDWLATLWKGFGTSAGFFGFAFIAGIVRKGLGSEVV